MSGAAKVVHNMHLARRAGFEDLQRIWGRITSCHTGSSDALVVMTVLMINAVIAMNTISAIVIMIMVLATLILLYTANAFLDVGYSVLAINTNATVALIKVVINRR